MPKGRGWTYVEEQHLRDAINEGASHREIGEELNRSRSAVRHKAAVLRIRGRQGRVPDPYKRSLVLQLLESGHNLCRIADITGVGNYTVQRMVRRMTRDKLVKRTGTHTRNVRYVVL